MVWAARIIGVVIGFAAGIIISEVIWPDVRPHDGDWTNAIPFTVAVVGWLVGTAVGRRVTNETPEQHPELTDSSSR